MEQSQTTYILTEGVITIGIRRLQAGNIEHHILETAPVELGRIYSIYHLHDFLERVSSKPVTYFYLDGYNLKERAANHNSPSRNVSCGIASMISCGRCNLFPLRE